MLALYNPEKEYIIKTDTSDYISANIFSQPNGKGLLYPIIFFLKKYSPAKYNYKIYDKELLIVVLAFQK